MAHPRQGAVAHAPTATPAAAAAATLAVLPDSILIDVFRTFVDGSSAPRPPGPLCRIEAALALIRLRRVCVRWRDLIQSDAVARHALGTCCQIPSGGCRLLNDLPSDFPAAAWHDIFDVWDKDPWRLNEPPFEDEDNKQLLALWGKPIYRRSEIRQWRCGRAPPPSARAAAAAAEPFVPIRRFARTRAGYLAARAYQPRLDAERSRLAEFRLSHGGDPCALPGGWFDLLVDVTLMAWLHARLGRQVTDDGEGAYYDRATLPVHFSSPWRVAADAECNNNAATSGVVGPSEDTAAEASSEPPAKATSPAAAVLDRQAFDHATGGAYVPEFPLRFTRIAGPHEWNGQSGELTPEDVDLLGWRPARELCKEQCAFCTADGASRYYDWRDSSEGTARCADEVCHGWALRKIALRCRGSQGAGDKAAPVSWFTVTPAGHMDDFTFHTYVLAVHPKTKRLLGVVSWYSSGSGP
ncbi:hypothetical protein HK405_009772 [Cladochytrium tenue]|nr:hypothetical protein HK405_009772 [Cladochytrium tenue]